MGFWGLGPGLGDGFRVQGCSGFRVLGFRF